MAGVEQLDPTRSLRDIGRAMRELELAIPSAGPERVTEAAVNLFRVLNERGLINADALMRGGQSNPSTLENGLASMKEALVDGIPSQASTCLSNNLGSFLPPEIRRQVRNLPEMEFNETNFKLFENPGGIGEILGGPAWPNSMSQLAIAAVNESLRTGQPLSGLRLKDAAVTDAYLNYIFRKDKLKSFGDQCMISEEKRTVATDLEKADILRPYFTIDNEGGLTIGPKLANYIESRVAGTSYDLDASPEREAERKVISNLPKINSQFDRDSLMGGSPFVSTFVGNYVLQSIEAALHEKKPLKDVTLFLSRENIEVFNASWKRDHKELTQTEYFKLKEDGSLMLTPKLIERLKENLDTYGLGALAATSRDEVMMARHNHNTDRTLPGQSWEKVAPLKPLLGEEASRLLAFFVHRGTSYLSAPVSIGHLTAQTLEQEFIRAPKPYRSSSEGTESSTKRRMGTEVLATELIGLFDIREGVDKGKREVRLGPVGEGLLNACIEGRIKNTEDFKKHLNQLWEQSASVEV